MVKFLKFSNKFMALLFYSKIYVLGCQKMLIYFQNIAKTKKSATSPQHPKKFSHEIDQIKKSKKEK